METCREGRPRVSRDRWRLLPVTLLAALCLAFLGLGAAPSGGASTVVQPQTADTGVLMEWPLPPNRGPFDLVYDNFRGYLWFGEGNHTNPPIDQVGALDPTTGVLREWGAPTAGGTVHATGLDRSHNFWFSEVAQSKLARLVPESNTITEWSLYPGAEPHSIAVDDIVTSSVKVWFSERELDVISSLDPATGIYVRHPHPLPTAWPHTLQIAPDHSIWFVETCGNRVGQLVPGNPEVWHFWQPPTPAGICNPPNGIGPLFGQFVGNDFWYSEPYNGNIIRLSPSQNTFYIWPVPGAANGAKQLTEISPDPNGDIFFTEMDANQVGRLEPNGSSMPTVVVVTPTVISQPAPAEATAVPLSVVYTPVVTQLTPVTDVITGTRNGGIVEWALPTVTPSGGRFIGPARGTYAGGGFWISEVSADRVSRFLPFTPTPVPATATATSTLIPPTATATAVVPTATAVVPTVTSMVATPSPTSCPIQFSDVPVGSTFYDPVRCLACRGIISGYPDGSFKPNNPVTRGQLSKIVAGAAGWTDPVPANQQTFEDVVPDSTFWIYVERMFAHGAIGGYPCGQVPTEPCIGPTNRPYFRTAANASRGQVSKIVSTAAGFNEDPGGQRFEDVPSDSPFFVWINRLVIHGVISGYACGGPGEPCVPPNSWPYFRPNAQVSRGQLSKMAANTFFPGCVTPAR